MDFCSSLFFAYGKRFCQRSPFEFPKIIILCKNISIATLGGVAGEIHILEENEHLSQIPSNTKCKFTNDLNHMRYI